jgi:hypothetical protein
MSWLTLNCINQISISLGALVNEAPVVVRPPVPATHKNAHSSPKLDDDNDHGGGRQKRPPTGRADRPTHTIKRAGGSKTVQRQAIQMA